MKKAISLIVTAIFTLCQTACSHTESKNYMSSQRPWGVTFHSAALSDPSFYDPSQYNYISIRAAIFDASPYETRFYDHQNKLLRSFMDFFPTVDTIQMVANEPIGGQIMYSPLPSRFKMHYYSRYERKTYSLDAQLPLAQLQKWFATPYTGYITMQKKPQGKGYPKDAFDHLQVWIGPQGYVTLFAGGSYWNMRREIASFQAKEIPNITMEQAYAAEGYRLSNFIAVIKESIRDKEDYHTDVKKNDPRFYQHYIASNRTVRSSWYKSMQERFPWNLEVEAEGGEWFNHYSDTEFANGERWQVFDDNALIADRQTLKAIPTSFQVWLRNASTGKKYRVVVFPFGLPEGQSKNNPDIDDVYCRYPVLYNDKYLSMTHMLFTKFFESHTKNGKFNSIRLKFDKDFNLSGAYLEKEGEQIRLPRAFAVNLAEIGDKPDNFRWGM